MATEGVKFGPPPIVVDSIFNLHPEALEQICQYVEQRGLRTPVSQVVGFTQFVGHPATDVLTEESTSSTTYGDLATVGPSLNNLGDGKYLLFFGCAVRGTGGGGFMSVSLNGDTPTDARSCFCGGLDSNGDGLPDVSTMRTISATLTGGSNTVVAKYRSAGGLTPVAPIFNRWLAALRYANVR
jgi:hypothetical protein